MVLFMRQRSVVLLSSGLDSTVNLFEARAVSDVVLALTFDYGQRAARREAERAAEISRIAGVSHRVLSLPWFADFTRTSLVDHSADIPTRDEVSIDDFKASTQTAKAVWVPNRNGIFLNIAAAFAEGLGASWIVPGFNAEEAVTFPDNSEAYLQAATRSLSFSTSNRVEVKCFTTSLDKTAIARRGRELGAPLNLVWPCYFGGEAPCGQCESCQRFRRASAAAASI